MLEAMNTVLLERVMDAGLAPREGVALGLPSGFILSEERLRMFFARLGLDGLTERRLEGIWPLARDVTAGWEGQRRETLWIQVGDATFKSWNPAGMIRVLRCNRCWHDPMGCQHVLALYVALGYLAPEVRAVMLGSLWELQLLSRLPEEASIASLPLPNDDDRQRHQGWIRYIIHVPSSDDDVAFNAPNYRGLVERCLIRLGLRDGRELKPQPWPGSIDDAEQSIEGLTEADRAADRALQRLESLYVVLKNAYGPERYASARALVEHAASDVLRCLANVRDVRLGDRPIRVGTAAVKPEIHVGGDTEGASAVELSWKPTIEQLVDVGHGFVLDGSGMLRPLDRHIPARMKPLMVEPLPSVPVDDVERFVEAFVVKSPVPVRLRRSSAWGARQRGQFERQVLL
ncbi:MAG: hypothetical protein AAFX99_20530 [Myxococcota bacterium]